MTKRLVENLACLIKRLPARLQSKLYEIILKNIPFWLLKQIPCSYGAYLKCYSGKKGNVIIDCGAHIGNCAILFSRLVGKDGLVISVEPFEDTFNTLTRRLKRLKIKNVIAVNKGLWDKTLKQRLKVFSNTISCKVMPNENKPEEAGYAVEIDCIAIDDLVAELNLTRVDMIKMDIEGTEIEALHGAKRTLREFTPCLAIASYHNRNNTQTYHLVEQFLAQHNYSAYTFFPPHLTTCGKHITKK
ncbi:MAG: FkbM family methyltransferase [Desulfobacterales bacterium]|nr:MAG: FkbM family methyltransferase [Desulfobacterales bacterium]